MVKIGLYSYNRAYRKLLIGANGGINEANFNVAVQSTSIIEDLYDVPTKNSPESCMNPIIESIQELPQLDQYDFSVVEYVSGFVGLVGGFVGKQVALHQKCDRCFRLLLKQEKKENTLIAQKEAYCLLHPRSEIVEIVSRCEKRLKSMKKVDF